MLKVYVLKRGGSFVHRSGGVKYTRNVKDAALYFTRDEARMFKRDNERVYRLVLGVKEVEKVR